MSPRMIPAASRRQPTPRLVDTAEPGMRTRRFGEDIDSAFNPTLARQQFDNLFRR